MTHLLLVCMYSIRWLQYPLTAVQFRELVKENKVPYIFAFADCPVESVFPGLRTRLQPLIIPSARFLQHALVKFASEIELTLPSINLQQTLQFYSDKLELPPNFAQMTLRLVRELKLLDKTTVPEMVLCAHLFVVFKLCCPLDDAPQDQPLANFKVAKLPSYIPDHYILTTDKMTTRQIMTRPRLQRWLQTHITLPSTSNIHRTIDWHNLHPEVANSDEYWPRIAQFFSAAPLQATYDEFQTNATKPLELLVEDFGTIEEDMRSSLPQAAAKEPAQTAPTKRPQRSLDPETDFIPFVLPKDADHPSRTYVEYVRNIFFLSVRDSGLASNTDGLLSFLLALESSCCGHPRNVPSSHLNFCTSLRMQCGYLS
eukprot:m.128681 g.128681  ORF g.128681 m.128681 type:complete len:370 (-) comp52297_c0_seq14:352-1461(-)